MPRGGKRKGAGRPKGTGKFGEPTKAVRLPVSKIDLIMQFIERNADMYSVYKSGEATDKADDYLLANELLADSAATFMVRASDDSMKGAGIHSNDMLIVDRSFEPKQGDIVIAALNGKLMIRRLFVKNKKMELKVENAKFKTIRVTDDDDIEIWGVAVNVVHSLAN